MYNWDFCDQNMSLARLVRWVPPSAALGLSSPVIGGGGFDTVMYTGSTYQYRELYIERAMVPDCYTYIVPLLNRIESW